MSELWILAVVVAAVIVCVAWMLGIPPALVGLVYLAGAVLTFAVALVSRLVGRPLIDDLPDALRFSLAWPLTAVGWLMIELWLRVVGFLSPIWKRACTWWKPPQRG